MTAPTITLAARADLADVVRLLCAQMAEHELPATQGGIERAASAMIEDKRLGAIFVARIAGRAVGLACITYTWSLELAGLTSWLDELFVEPELRSRGLGRALLRAAIEHARADGAAAVDLEVVEGHERAANLYEREGFFRRPRTRWALSL